MNDVDGIFIIASGNGIQRVPHRKYAEEQALEVLVSEHPELLVGNQIDPEDPPRWLVVGRQVGIPDTGGGSDRWALDVLLLDQHGCPTFVEIKRSTDPRIRRDVVGQMLDYAANAQSYWPKERIRALATETAGGSEQLDAIVAELVAGAGGEISPQNIDEYWESVERNLRSGEVRLLFVADKIPLELKRIIEYLNQQMLPAEVLGIEIRQYQDADIRALVPRVVGLTELARQQKQGRVRTSALTNQESFMSTCSEGAKKFFEELFRQATKRNIAVQWGTKGFSLRLKTPSERLVSLFYGYPPSLDGYEYPLFQAYLGYLEREEDHERGRDQFSKCMPFAPRGKHTLQIELNEQGASSASAGLAAVLDAAESIAKTLL